MNILPLYPGIELDGVVHKFMGYLFEERYWLFKSVVKPKQEYEVFLQETPTSSHWGTFYKYKGKTIWNSDWSENAFSVLFAVGVHMLSHYNDTI